MWNTQSTTPSLQDARYFLLRVLAWDAPDKGYINIHHMERTPGQAKTLMPGKPCATLDEAVAAVAASMKKGNRDIYVCLSTQTEKKTLDGQYGPFDVAVRLADNAKFFKALWIDLDVEANNKSGKAYPDARAALTALFAFCAAVHMPAPTMFVKSGSGGYHCYWCLDRALTKEEWEPLAYALTDAMLKHGLKCDTGCTKDLVRVLRVPDTKNFKSNPPTDVALEKNLVIADYKVEMIRTILQPYMRPQGATIIPFTPRGNSAPGLNDDLGGGIQQKAPPILLDSVANAGCGFIAGAIATGGRDYHQPLWNLTTLIATFTEGGRNDAHRMAQGHPTYDPQDTDALFDRKVDERAKRDIGWPSCDTVAREGCKSCMTCPLRGPGTRPLQFGRQALPPVPSANAQLTPDLPKGYQRGPDGKIRGIKLNREGEPEMFVVMPYLAYEPTLIEEDWTLMFKTKIGHKERLISITSSQCSSVDKFNGAMAAQGVVFKEGEKKPAKDFFVSWIEQLQQTKDAVINTAPFGWAYADNALQGFCFGGRMHGPSGVKPSAQPVGQLAQHYTPRGNLDQWKNVAKLVTDTKAPQLDAYIASAFAGPLVHFTGLKGLVLSTYSTDSGFGKSTAMNVAQTVWGAGMSIAQLTDTDNSLFGKMGKLAAIPTYWDEIKTEEDRARFVKIVFQTTGGREKTRMNADATLKSSGSWETLLVAASNESILDAVADKTKTTAAGVLRVFEYKVARPKMTVPNAIADQMSRDLRFNYGRAGEVYAEFLGQNYEAIHQAVKDRALAMEAKYMKAKEERFWINTITVLVMGAEYANALKLTEIDTVALEDFLVTSLGKLRTVLKDAPVDMNDPANISNVVSQYLNARRKENTIYTNRMWLSPGKAPAGYIKAINDVGRLSYFAVHIGVEDQTVRLNLTDFKGWLSEKGYAQTAVIGTLKDQYGAKQYNSTLGGGLGLRGNGAQQTITFIVAGTPLAGMIEFE